MATIMATISPNEDPPEKQRYGHDMKIIQFLLMMAKY